MQSLRNGYTTLNLKYTPVWINKFNDIIGQMTLAPLVMMCTKLEAIMLREFEIARGICASHAKELDDVYLSHVDKFKGTVRNTVNRIYESEQ